MYVYPRCLFTCLWRDGVSMLCVRMLGEAGKGGRSLDYPTWRTSSVVSGESGDCWSEIQYFTAWHRIKHCCT